MQIDIDIGSSTVANGVLGLVFGVITTLVVDMAFLVQVLGFTLGPMILFLCCLQLFSLPAFILFGNPLNSC